LTLARTIHEPLLIVEEQELSIYEIRECIRLLEQAGNSCFSFSCTLSVSVIALVLSLVALLDALRRSIMCDTPSTCLDGRGPEIIMGIVGLIVAMVIAVTAFNIETPPQNLGIINLTDYEKIRLTGGRLGLEILPQHSISNILMLFRNALAERTTDVNAIARNLFGIFPVAPDTDANKVETITILIQP
jgi:hypothetical protein